MRHKRLQRITIASLYITNHSTFKLKANIFLSVHSTYLFVIVVGLFHVHNDPKNL